ncbi:two-component system response regulator VicR [Aequitasia blattaphilus]|uniref:Stage 0 sporulation protein A homolog n=1 Tax=Aequitasia blattaphilus TaxID=2949332 RepID=A0ABT1EBW9_9FIRM|nr:response regulator transcription factor [Aequitasia blattaphilus]MCP1102437.1 response regulator transcription factor [Aequitasia blattaphilus]MCR8615077.1 response regulator transcription factor [Aequitasia blattaphilus]
MDSLIKNKKILIVDDEKEIVNILRTVLLKEGFRKIYAAQDGKTGLQTFYDVKPDLVILDIMLPDQEGYDVCKEIRYSSNIPILFLSAKTEEIDRVLGLSIGADDYITKPFSPREVTLRVKINLKKNIIMDNTSKEDLTLKFGPYKIDQKKVEVTKRGEVIQLKPKEYRMFLFMANNLNHIISKEQFCNKVWGEDFEGFDNTIMVHIRRLREKLEDDPSNPQYILNVKGLGYKLSVKDEE